MIKYTAWPKESYHLNLTKQMGMSLLLESYSMGDNLAAGRSYLTQAGAMTTSKEIIETTIIG